MNNKRQPLSFIPPLLPDQTLYSWVSIFHEMSGNATEQETLIQLFGSERAGRHFHIPSHLATFCAATQLTLGPPEVIATSATILPAYLRFRPNSTNSNVLQRIYGNQTAGIAQTLRTSSTPLHTFPPRRYCRLCIERDLQREGIAYWHRTHQLPGVLVCIDHGIPLSATPMSSHDNRHGKLFTPEQDLLNASEPSSANQYSDRQLFILDRLALLAQQIATTQLPGGYTRTRLRQACIAALIDRGLFDSDTTACAMNASRDYANHFAPTLRVPDLAPILSERSTRLLWNLLSNTQHTDHPIEYLLLIDWLFGNWEIFWSQYSKQQRDVTTTASFI